MAPALVEVPLQDAINYAKSGTGAYKVRIQSFHGTRFG
jgi:hypothetical protein